MSILHSGDFLDYKDNTIRVTFYNDSNTTGKTNDLKFTGKLPVVINKNGDTNNVFEPLHSTSCDISIVSSRILSDLYSTDKKAIKVKVEQINKQGTTTRLFEGYMTPNTYSQHISPNLDNIDMTAICPIATLKYLRVDDILEKSKTITIGELLGKSLAEVKIDADLIEIEDAVVYDGNIRLIDMLLQTSNFWDEGDEPDTLYNVVSECLRLFGYTMTFTGEKYIIYMAIADHNTTVRKFLGYKIQNDGSLKYYSSSNYDMTKYQFKHNIGEWTTIDDNPTISIDTVYDRIDGVASTKIPNYSTDAFDLIDVEDRDKYDAGDVNIALNKIKGYNTKGQMVTDDEWYYIWNGVYLAPEFGLSVNGTTTNGYANINNAYCYMTGQTGHPNAYGGLLNFYGGEINLIGTGRDPQEERAVDVKQCITVFAPDNGVVPEFLERSDLEWSYSAGWDPEEGYSSPTCSKKDIMYGNSTNSKFGVNKDAIADAISYKQVFENITMMDGTEMALDIDMSQSYSRTGINQKFDISNYSNVENKTYHTSYDGEGYETKELDSGKVYMYPWSWQSSYITVDYGYFDKYKVDNGLSPVFDKRKVIAYVKMLDGTIYQFNGKEWVETTAVSDDNAFYLVKLMNKEKIFNDEFRYNVIACADGETYALKEDGVTYYTKNGKYITDYDDNGCTTHKATYYGASHHPWYIYVNDASEGRLSIILPTISGVNCEVGCEIYHSSLLGMTGNKEHRMKGTYALSAYYKNDYSGDIQSVGLSTDAMPINATYIKAEHLDINISLSVPEGNLGQMFGESDIKYQTAPSKKFRESYDVPEFLVNTKHQIVSQSHSYLIIGNGYADPAKFKIGCNNMIYSRPENYVMQGYKNYYGNIRKQYNRVLVPNKEGFSNAMVFIEAPDIPNNGNGRWLMVVSDSNDVKTNRHTISAVEDYGIGITEINNYTVIEIPRKSRNPRYDLPSVVKK